MNKLIMLNQIAVEYHKALKPKRKVSNKKWIKAIESICEEYHGFRDYEIMPASEFRTNDKIGIHKLIDDFQDLEYEINDAINTFCRDGYPCIYFYI